MGEVILYQQDNTVIYDMAEIMNEYDQDWDCDDIYYKIDMDGKVTKVNIQTGDIFEYMIE